MAIEGVEWYDTLDDAMQYARDHLGYVVVKCSRLEGHAFAAVSAAQPLARLLTRGGSVVWQGSGDILLTN